MTIAMKSPEISRRSVLAGLSGMSFCFALGAEGVRLIPQAQAATDPRVLSPWVRIAPDGTITILSSGAEMGQGSMTSLPLIVAEEMDADWAKVAIEWAPADPTIYGSGPANNRSMSITGSRAVRSYFDDLRIAGAQVRKVMLINAAEKWGVDPASLKTEPGVVIDPASGRRLSYGEIAASGKIPDPLPKVEPDELKKKNQFRLIGKSVPRRDLPAKVNGTAQYTMDVKVPGMVYATSLHSPAHGNAPESWNDAAIKAMPGVIGTVKLKDGIAVVAEQFPQAMAARAAIKAAWKKGQSTGFNSQRAMED